ncbi:MAG TPA: hypothetical protein VFN61_14550 [Acidimicrobiales bacterium]|nr:hypothetical protein [Acidimicrobiales bacterium]
MPLLDLVRDQRARRRAALMTNATSRLPEDLVRAALHVNHPGHADHLLHAKMERWAL